MLKMIEEKVDSFPVNGKRIFPFNITPVSLPFQRVLYSQ